MYSPRLKDKYTGTIVPALKEKFGYKNVMEIPKLVKISINQGVGAAVSDKKLVDTAVIELDNNCWSESSSNLFKKRYFEF
jgi:large subunit ribosomal protein L5